ncbi:MAG: fibronectin type III-like domain-contianing protein, partial [Bacteroidales bacterium]|nr:fibronectin type III-like domain-contianing protein [Bacteroidales bacterium]
KFRRPKVKTMEDGTKALVVKVRNTGRRDGDEIVQLYVSRPDDQEGPVKTLRGFQRVSIKAHKAVRVSIPLDEETFSWWDAEAGRVVPRSGKYVLHVGGSSDEACLRKVETVI